MIVNIRCCDKLPGDVISGSCTDRCRQPVRLLPCWILGRTKGADGGLEPPQGTKAAQLWAENHKQVRQMRIGDVSVSMFHRGPGIGPVHQTHFEVFDYLCI